MSKDYHQQALGGTRETALEAVCKVRADIDRYGGTGHKEARKHQLMFACNVLTGICKNCQTMQQNAHLDIYVDIYTLVLAPKLEPKASPVHWKRLLPMLEFFFMMLTRYKLRNEANQLYEYLRTNQLKWDDLDDLKHLLKIHGNQLQLVSMHEPNGTDTSTIIEETFQALETLFINASDRLKEHSMDPNALLREFMNSIITQRPSFQTRLATKLQSVHLERMYKAFFEMLVGCMNSNFPTDPEKTFIEHLQALNQFHQIDVQAKLQQQIALQYSRILRDKSILWKNEFIEHGCALLYNLFKFAYVRVRIGNFKEAYTQVCNKFCSLLANRGKALMQQEWFQHFVGSVFLLLVQMHAGASEIFDVFWQQMERCLYISHIKLIADLEKLTPFMQKTNFVQFDCCKDPNNWYHFQLKYAQIAIDAYNQLLKQYKEEHISEAVKTEISELLNNSIDTVIKMEHECSKSSLGIRKLCVAIATLLQEETHGAHASDLLYLAGQMTRLKSRISPDDWRMIMRRVNKTASVCGDDDLATEILACYIADLIGSPSEPDFMTLHSLMQFHHYNGRATSLFKVYSLSTSEFKPSLQKHQRRLFHWLEAQYVFKVYDKEKHRELYATVAQRAQTKYDFLNAVHAGKLLDENSILTKVKNIYEMLKSSSKLSPLEELTLAHTTCSLLFKRCEELKVSMAVSDFQEGYFAQLFQQQSLLSLCAMKEMAMIEMAMNAFQGFDGFFKRLDTEPLDPSDGGFLDWARILEDLVSLAMYLQAVGYLDYASEAWLLHYRIANTIDDVQSSLRSLAFLCEYNGLFENDERLQLSKEVDKKSECLPHILEKLPQLLRRQQNFTLTCICQMSYYYACQKRFYKSKSLLRLVHIFHKCKLDRQHKYDIVLFTADVVAFRILLKHEPPQDVLALKAKAKATSNEDECVLHEIDVILQRMRNFVNVSSADMQPYTLLLLSALDDFADTAINRLCDNFLSGLLCSALKLCVETGLAVRTAQLLSKWVLINLNMEFLQKAEIKMQMIECILGLRDSKELHASLKAAKSCPFAVSKQLQNEDEYGITPTELEEVRKAPVASTLTLIQEQIYKPTMELDHKLEICSRTKAIGKSSQITNVVLWSRLTLNCLRARFNFLSHNYSSLQILYENCEKWLRKRKQTIYFKIFQSTVLMSMGHYGDFLRAIKGYDKAVDYLKMCIEHCSSMEGKLDKNYLINFALQLHDTEVERSEYLTRILPPCKKKRLPIEFKLSEVSKTPIAKSTKYCHIAKTSSKKPPSNSAFVIFSDTKAPRQTPSQNAPKVPKGLCFSQSSSEGSGYSGDESSTERKTNKKSILDICQTIELSDSDDDDDYVEQLKPNTTNNTNKKTERPKPKLKFLDSVELLDLMPSSSTSVTRAVKTDNIKKTPRNKKAKDASLGLVNKMQKLTLVSTATATASKVDVPPAEMEQRSNRLTASQPSKTTQSTVPSIEISGSDDSHLKSEVASLPLGSNKRTKRTKRIKTPEPELVNDAATPVVPIRMTRLRARQASTSRNENTPEISPTIASLHFRRRI